ncbi:uncharacterized protein [Littorina saxatilis]|uniref:uncharacterized protein isoform X2 n=1 Tax=Littorina saxatilis TaxID=31220 RepID=UPI0038B42205
MADADTRGERRSRYITTDTVEPGGRGQRFKTREYFPHFSYGQRMVQAALAKSLPAIPLPDDTSNHPVDCSFEPQALVTEDSTSSHHSVDSQMSEGHIRGSDTLRKFVTSAQLAEPQFITSTSLRKQVATLSQIVSLKDNELDALAQFMGHDVRTHREYYRLPSDMMQLAKVSKLLLALEKGKLQDHQRCTLDEMEVAEDEAITSDEEAEFVEKGHSPIPERSASGRFATKDSLAPPHNQPSPPMHQPCPATAAPDSEPPSSWTFSPVGVAMMNKRCSVFTQITSPSASSNESSTDNEYLPEQWSHSKPKKLKSKATRNSSNQPRRLWLEEEVKAVEAHLLKYIATQVLPRKEDIQKCLQAEEALKNRTWLHVKNYVRNRITALQRNQRN